MISKTTYKKIAHDHGITVDEVKREIQSAIEYAYKNPQKSESEKLLQENINHKDEIPTPEELVAYVLQEIKRQELKNILP